ncbi:MAG: glycerol-3-phosphate 1-O-acyltransferase [Planctomycetota bacterium]|nr:MAG: glycerol-3-phosphate 1-O-acyltransferase [Planctomycetota bacterium]
MDRNLLLAAGAGYLSGSISFALLVARAKGVDLRAHGSGNPGATNAGRVLGRKYGVLVYLLDALKGALPAGVSLILGWPPSAAVLGAAGAFAGHLWPIWFGFRGGKGVATYSGAMLVLAPGALLAGAVAFLVVVLATRVVALGSLALGIVTPAALRLLDPTAATGERAPVFAFAAVGGALFFLTHRRNLARLLARRKEGA